MSVARRWLGPVLVMAVATFDAACGSGSGAAPDRVAPGSSTTATPTTSSATVSPSTVAGPGPAGLLTAALTDLLALLPPDSCLVVEGPGVRFEHRGNAPVVPASTAKLLTATAALEVLGPSTVLDDDRATVLDQVERMLRDSDDELAARLEAEVGGPATTAAVLAAGGVDLTAADVVDGTGHSHDNRVTCNLLVDLLRRPGTGPLLENGLAVAGRSGTLAWRFRGTPLDGVLAAKTGSLTSVEALAGLVDDGDPPLTFALVVNTAFPTPLPDDLAPVEQQIGEALAAWPAEAPRA